MVPDESDSDGAADGSSSWQDGDGQLPDPFTGDAPDSPARSPWADAGGLGLVLVLVLVVIA
jgi:hypothetical protein